MADGLKAALQAKLVAYESAGLEELAQRQRDRLAELEKTIKADAKATENAVAKTPVAKKAAPKKSVLKKAVKQTARKKK